MSSGTRSLAVTAVEPSTAGGVAMSEPRPQGSGFRISSHTRREFLTAAAGLGAAASCAQPFKRPNLLFLFSDQQRTSAVSCYGGDPVRTPAIDRLAADGCRFDNAISINPVCSPYRGMLHSGLYSMRNGIVGNDTPLSNGLPTFGKMFRNAGYKTGYIGKWHIESHRAGFVPPERRQGFDDFWAVHSCNHDHFNSPYYRDDPETELTHVGYEPVSQTDLAIEFMRKCAGGSDPFCLVMSFGPPHDPYKAPDENEARFKPESDIPLPENLNDRAIVDELLRTDNRPMTERNERGRARGRARIEDDGRLRAEVLRGYYGACEALDESVARLTATLDELGIADDTIVVYTSDHGDLAGSHRMISKQSPLEESIHVPFVLRYPRGVPSGVETAAIMTPVDILPTMLGLAGIDFDADSYDGVDRCAASFGAASDDREAAPLMKMVHGGMPWIMNGMRPWRGVRTHRHTYVELEGEPWLLFDNQEDPHQMANLIRDTERAGLRSDLAKQMKELMEDAGDTMTEDEIAAFRRQQVQQHGT